MNAIIPNPQPIEGIFKFYHKIHLISDYHWNNSFSYLPGLPKFETIVCMDPRFSSTYWSTK